MGGGLWVLGNATACGYSIRQSLFFFFFVADSRLWVLDKTSLNFS